MEFPTLILQFYEVSWCSMDGLFLGESREAVPLAAICMRRMITQELRGQRAQIGNDALETRTVLGKQG